MIVQAKYLQSASMLSRAYSRICVAVAAALRMGLHVSDLSSQEHYNAHQRCQRRRVFAVLNMMDTYVSDLLYLDVAACYAY